MNEYTKPLPTPTADSQPFWDACRDEKLTCQRCDDCNTARFPPHHVCPNCLSVNSHWEEMSGKGSVFSFTVFRRVYDPGFADEVPYVVALIELDEGPRMLSNVVSIDPDKVVCGMPVKVVFEKATQEITLPKFEPTES